MLQKVLKLKKINKEPYLLTLSIGLTTTPQFFGVGYLIPKTDNQINKNQMTELLLPYNRTIRLRITIRPNIKLSRGEICVANLIPPCEWCESG